MLGGNGESYISCKEVEFVRFQGSFDGDFEKYFF